MSYNRKKQKANKQFYAIAAATVLLTLCSALLIVYISAKGDIDKAAKLSQATNASAYENLESLENFVPVSDTQEESSNDVSVEPVEPVDKNPQEKPSSIPIKAEIPKPNKHKSAITQGVDFSLTQEEIEKIESIINLAENEVYYTPVSSKETSSKSTSSKSTSSKSTSSTGKKKPEKEEKPPPEKRSISIYFEDLGSGYSYSYNDDKKYFIASLIKAPYAMYLYTLAEEGKCDLDEVMTIKYEDVQEGTGDLAKKKETEFPIKMTVQELITACIRSSDNTAMEKLRDKYPSKMYYPYAKKLGLKYPTDVKDIVNGNITAYDANVYIKAIYDYIENGKYGGILQADMEHTTNSMIKANYPIARKYGWADLSFHDMAIVYAKSPYVLTICSDASLGKKSDYKLFSDLSKAFAEFHQKRYP